MTGTISIPGYEQVVTLPRELGHTQSRRSTATRTTI